LPSHNTPVGIKVELKLLLDFGLFSKWIIKISRIFFIWKNINTHIKYHFLYRDQVQKKKDLVGANVDDSSGNSLLVHHRDSSFGVPFVGESNKTASTLFHLRVLDISAMAESLA